MFRRTRCQRELAHQANVAIAARPGPHSRGSAGHGQEHDHDDRDHDRLPEQLPDDDGTNLVIVLELPDAILRVRGPSTGDVGGTRIARSLPLVAMDAVPTEGTPNWRPRPGSAAPDLRADRTVAGILLTSHALLL